MGWLGWGGGSVITLIPKTIMQHLKIDGLEDESFFRKWSLQNGDHRSVASRFCFFVVDNEAALIAVVGDQPPRNQLFFFDFWKRSWKRCFFWGGNSCGRNERIVYAAFPK